jgi:hypothetical protein
MMMYEDAIKMHRWLEIGSETSLHEENQIDTMGYN